jgi:phage anti-repressor protein/predicted GIY-YIG superfamily endonuclease
MKMETKNDIIKFVKQTTSIPNEFIDDFFMFYNENTLQTDLVIDLDIVAKWFGSRKSNILNTLRESKFYKQGIDYKIYTGIPNKTNPKANHFKYTLITPDCFKHLAMSTRAKKGHMVRTYFIEIESLFIKYRKQTMMGIEMEIKQLERNQRPRNMLPKGGYIYVVRASETKDSVYKIGRTKSLVQRLRSHNSTTADDLEIMSLYKTDNIEAVEKCTHVWLKKYKYRKYKEIYQVNLDIIKKVISTCGAVGSAVVKLEATLPSQNRMQGGLYMVAVPDEPA